MGFQTQVNETAGVGVPGDFADHNPRASVPAGPGGLSAGPSGCTIGNFAWLSPLYVDWDNAPAVLNSFGTGLPAGIIANEMQTTLTTFLAETTYVVKAGYMLTAYQAGSFWVKNSGLTTAVPGQYAYANFIDGSINFAAASAALTYTVATTTVTQTTSTIVCGIVDNTMTVASATAGVYPGMTMSGGTVVSGTQVTAQLTPLLAGETANGVGRYSVSIAEQTVAAGSSLTGTYGSMTLGATPSGVFAAGMVITGTGLTGTVFIGQLISGSGGVSGAVFATSWSGSTTGSVTITATRNVQTKWVAMSQGAAAELVKISTWVLG